MTYLLTSPTEVEKYLDIGVGDGSFCSTGKGALSAPTNSLDRAMARSIQRFRDIQKHKNKEREKKNLPKLPERKVEFQVVQEYGSTMCCCACGQLTEPALVTIRDQNTGEMTTRRSRLRSRPEACIGATGTFKALGICCG